jgi:hypothetical protein
MNKEKTAKTHKKIYETKTALYETKSNYMKQKAII